MWTSASPSSAPGESRSKWSLSLPPPPPALLPLSQVDDNHLGLVGDNPGEDPEPGAPPGSTMVFFIHELKSGSTEHVGSVWTATPGDVDDDGFFLRAPFDLHQQWAAGGGIYWFGNPEEPEIEGHTTGGTTVGISLEADPRRVTKEDESRWKEYRLGTASTPDMERAFRRWHRRVEFPEHLPFYQEAPCR